VAVNAVHPALKVDVLEVDGLAAVARVGVFAVEVGVVEGDDVPVLV
jgi:hypothetical protein